MVDDETRADTGLEHAETAAGPAPGPRVGHVAIARYRGGELLGRGGMGEVVKVTDVEIGREIAIKRMRDVDADAEMTARFLREAQIQARLEHPAVVPVYELGKDDAGRPYFTMKRIGGTTLAQLLATDPDASRRRGLRALVDVARAIDFAHRHGIVHRDLKPANVMLGEFGEVHVLDWGVARVLVENAPTPHTIQPSEALDASAIDSATRHGDVVGTRGYMAPEQARGEPVDRPADVYSLGAVLFEVLAGEPLHPRGEPAIESTLAGVKTGPRERRPDRDVPPELDTLCLAALASDATRRPTARMFAETLQRFLDGDRDEERRRHLAADHLAAARAAWTSRAQGNDLEARTIALREAGRALSLDPELVEAADLVEELRTRPTKHQPPEVQRVIADLDRQATRKEARMAALTLGAHIPFTVIAISIGVTDWRWFAAYVVAALAVIASATRDWRTGSVFSAWTTVVVGALLVAVATRLFGPFVIVPSVAAATTISLIAFPPLREHPVLVVAIGIVGWLGPVLLEAAGVLAPSFTISNGTITSHSILALDGWGGAALVILVNVGVVVANAAFMFQIATERRAAQIGLAVQAWHDRQLSPAK